ncbi:hypothetical protein ACG83_07440 [Frankia sp. R43]|nr:hypothetical protein ACG83_07440 [Frankia sp. R43]
MTTCFRPRFCRVGMSGLRRAAYRSHRFGWLATRPIDPSGQWVDGRIAAAGDRRRPGATV